MPKKQHGYRPEAEGDELRIAGVGVRYPISAIAGDVAHDDTVVDLGKIPKGATILGAVVGLKTQFNAETSHTIDIGWTEEDYNDIVSGFDAKATAAGTHWYLHGQLPVQAVDRDVKVKVTQSGIESTAGSARVVVFYVSPVVPWPAETEPLGTLDPNKGRGGTHTP